jgi:hypothetical protein
VSLGVVIVPPTPWGCSAEWLTDHLTNLIWNDWTDSEEVRWTSSSPWCCILY